MQLLRPDFDKELILCAFIQPYWNEGNIDSVPQCIAEEYTDIDDPGDPWDGMERDDPGLKDRVCVSGEPVPEQFFDIQWLYQGENSV